jgi:hypothetical protein
VFIEPLASNDRENTHIQHNRQQGDLITLLLFLAYLLFFEKMEAYEITLLTVHLSMSVHLSVYPP